MIALDFEEPDQQVSLKRVNATLHQASTKLPYTLPDWRGELADMWDKVRQAVNLNTWLATLFIGKDGQELKATHAGFAARRAAASSTRNSKEEFTSNT